MSAAPLSVSESGVAFDRLAHYPKLALAVSGGPDSLALLHLAAEWRAAREAGPELHVLTVDHGLRAASREEALMVGRLASALRLPSNLTPPHSSTSFTATTPDRVGWPHSAQSAVDG